MRPRPAASSGRRAASLPQPHHTMSQYRLVVSEVVTFPVKLTVSDKGKPREFSFTLTGNRMPQEALQDYIEGGESNVLDVLRTNITGWEGQTLVEDEDKKPAAFNLDAFNAMLSLMGTAGVIFNAYLKACGAEGKAKNSVR